MIRASLVLAAWLLFATPLANADPASVTRQVADGRPWTMRTAQGNAISVTSHPTGTAELRNGMLALNATWRETPDGMCLRPPAAEERCVRLQRLERAIVGLRQGREAFRLSR